MYWDYLCKLHRQKHRRPENNTEIAKLIQTMTHTSKNTDNSTDVQRQTQTSIIEHRENTNTYYWLRKGIFRGVFGVHLFI